MDNNWKAILWNQFGAAMDMLENAVRACPDEEWGDFSRKPEWKKKDIVGFWYLVYHTLFFLDYYLTHPAPTSEKEFSPPAPFTLSEFDPQGALPDRVYTKEELLTYLDHCRQKLRRLMTDWTEEKAHRPSGIPYRDMSIAELLMYNMRHVQHHTAQLNLILRQKIDSAPDWVSKATAQFWNK